MPDFFCILILLRRKKERFLKFIVLMFFNYFTQHTQYKESYFLGTTKYVKKLNCVLPVQVNFFFQFHTTNR
jgi:hypothetical protein